MQRWQQDGIGRDRLQLVEVPRPEPRPGEVLVEVAAVALNYRDLMVIEHGRGRAAPLPFTPGSDLAGTVVARGEGADRFAVGDRVISSMTPDWLDGRRGGDARTEGFRTLGGYYQGVLAQHVAFPQGWFVRAPDTLDDAHASTLPCSGLTAWFALVEFGHVRPGDQVLVEGTGGVALFGLSIAKAAGAEVIVSTTAAKFDRARELGADHVVDRRGDWVDEVLRHTADHGVEHVLETVGGANVGNAVRVSAVGGHVHLIGVLEGNEVSAPISPVLAKQLTLHGVATGHRRALEDLVAAVDATGLRPVLAERYALDDLPAALDALERGSLGKIVVDVATP